MPRRTTRYIDLAGMRRLVDSVGLIETMEGIVENLRQDFARWQDFEKSPRTANHVPGGVIELMPVSDDRYFTFKYVNGHPGNIKQGLMTIMAFGALAEMQTGFPLLLSEMTILTALRTAATSVFAAKLLARPDSRTMAMIGNGAQSEFQILAFCNLLGIEEVRVYDPDLAATDKLIRNLSDVPCLRPIRTNSTAEAMKGADIVTTCTADKRFVMILEDAMVQPGMHINAVGGDCPGKTELDPKILERSKVIVEYEPQSRIEGEIQHMPLDFAVTELWEVLADPKKGRESASQITVFDSVGFAIEDFSALRFVLDESIARNIGEDIDLVPIPEDVRDLYGLLQPARRESL